MSLNGSRRRPLLEQAYQPCGRWLQGRVDCVLSGRRVDLLLLEQRRGHPPIRLAVGVDRRRSDDIATNAAPVDLREDARAVADAGRLKEEMIAVASGDRPWATWQPDFMFSAIGLNRCSPGHTIEIEHVELH